MKNLLILLIGSFIIFAPIGLLIWMGIEFYAELEYFVMKNMHWTDHAGALVIIFYIVVAASIGLSLLMWIDKD